MTYEEQMKEWKKKRQKIYKEYIKGKISKRALGLKYGVSNTRIDQILNAESKALDKTVNI